MRKFTLIAVIAIVAMLVFAGFAMAAPGDYQPHSTSASYEAQLTTSYTDSLGNTHSYVAGSVYFLDPHFKSGTDPRWTNGSWLIFNANYTGELNVPYFKSSNVADAVYEPAFHSTFQRNVFGQLVHTDFQLNTNSCASCHMTHTAQSRKLLFRNGVYSTCAACHDGTLGFLNVFAIPGGTNPFGGSQTAGTFAANKARNASVHLASDTMKLAAAPGGNRANVVESGGFTASTNPWGADFNCASCHGPHGSYSIRLLHYNPAGISMRTASPIGATIANTGGLWFEGQKLKLDAGKFKAEYEFYNIRRDVTLADLTIVKTGNYSMVPARTGTTPNIVNTYESFTNGTVTLTRAQMDEAVTLGSGAPATTTNRKLTTYIPENESPWLYSYAGGATTWDGRRQPRFASRIWYEGFYNPNSVGGPMAAVHGAGLLNRFFSMKYGKGYAALSVEEQAVLENFLAGKDADGVDYTDWPTAFTKIPLGTFDASKLRIDVGGVVYVQATGRTAEELAALPNPETPALPQYSANYIKTDTYTGKYATASGRNITGSTITDQNRYAYNLYCAACHTDYLLGSASANPADGSGIYSKAHRHTINRGATVGGTMQVKGTGNSLLCVSCHYVHGTDSSFQQLADAAIVDDVAAFEGANDVNHSSALKRYINMAVCWSCHANSSAATLKNTKWYWDGYEADGRGSW
ncbi:MAG: cytochrome c3 family protein [Clostridiales bacterium]|jgi:predicted CXXCH cytochrome family protein|nr:cytochrome c3 family protein [Clostridiales bacterium]